MSHARQLSTLERFVMQTKASIKHVTASPMRWFGLQYSEATVEVVPLLLSDVLKLPIKEIKACTKVEEA